MLTLLRLPLFPVLRMANGKRNAPLPYAFFFSRGGVPPQAVKAALRARYARP